jgi:hypothetical protein
MLNHNQDFDWSNAKDVWAKSKPMDCEEMLVEQVKQTTVASPGTTVWVYRNGIKALPWYTLVRKKLDDPDYAPWFLSFSSTVIANHSAAHVPVCDENFNPPKCSNLYHDHTQTPGYPQGDGNCSAPGCDVGSVPVGEYLFDPRAANLSIHGQTFVEWYVDEYLFGPTGAGNPNISGFYFDDDWDHCGQQKRICPSEMDHHAVDDMGLGASELAAILESFNWVMDQAYAAILGIDNLYVYTSIYVHTHTHTHTYIYACICMCWGCQYTFVLVVGRPYTRIRKVQRNALVVLHPSSLHPSPPLSQPTFARHACHAARGKFTWNQFWNAGRSCCIDCPDPMVGVLVRV